MNPRTTMLSVALIALFAACGDDTTEPAATTPPTVPAPALDGRTFLSVGATAFELVDGTRIRLSFDNGNLSANAGCNIMGGTYTVDGDTLRAGVLSMTEMACEQALMDQDDRLAGFLSGSPTIELSGDDLTLAAGDASIDFLDREIADPDRPLEGTRWVVTTIIEGDAASSIPTGATATVTIAEGWASVDAGCNTGSAEVSLGDGTITFGPLALTKMMCDEATMQLENAVVATLTGEVTYGIEAGTLTLTAASTGLQLQAGA